MAEVVLAEATQAPRAVRRRLTERLVHIGNLWLPTRAEMRIWHRAGAPLYVCWSGQDHFEIGPRLETMPAARFVPVYAGRLEPFEGGTRLVGRVRMPRATRWIFALLALMMVAWGVVTLARFAQGDTHAGWVGTWAVSTLIALGGPQLARGFGRRELERELPWLRAAVADAPDPDEDW